VSSRRAIKNRSSNQGARPQRAIKNARIVLDGYDSDP
jgi:hypothetical protein